MLFTRLEFFGLLAFTLVFLYRVGSARLRKLYLLAASYYFYAFWDWRFLALLMASTLCDFGVGRALSRCDRSRVRRAWLTLSLVANLGILGFYKYFDFFVVELSRLTGGWDPGSHLLGLVLPIGISFYTFQTLSYTIDVYRGRLQPTSSFTDFALYVAFFPQLVAGPIVRARELLPQLAENRHPSRDRLFAGAQTFVFGFFKKVFIADRVAVFVDGVFADAGAFDAVTTWLAVLAYAVQIYCDFSGYSDMAIGTARMLGYDFAENFRHPYLARSLSEFWRRWHISLSTWLRDYLYLPLGGSRGGRLFTFRNLGITMVLGGLWHGAALHFMAWGVWHGVALAVERAVAPRLLGGASMSRRIPPRLISVASWGVTTLVVVVGWVFFRATDFPAAGRLLSAMVGHSGGGLRWIHPFAAAALLMVAMWHLWWAMGPERWRPPLAQNWATALWLCFLVGLCFAYPPRDPNPFLYFQF